MARRHSKEGGNHLEQESNRQKTMEDADGGLHPAVDGQSLDKLMKCDECVPLYFCRKSIKYVSKLYQ